MKWLIISAFLILNSISSLHLKKEVDKSTKDISPPIITLKKDTFDDNLSFRACNIVSVSKNRINGKTLLKFKYRIKEGNEHDFFAIPSNDKDYFNIDDNTYEKLNDESDIKSSNSKYQIYSNKISFRKDSAMNCRISSDLEKQDLENNKEFNVLPEGISYRTS